MLIHHPRCHNRGHAINHPHDISRSFGDVASPLFLSAEIAARRSIYEFDLARAVRKPGAVMPREIARGGVLGAPRIAGRRIFTTRTTLCDPPEVVTLSLKGTNLYKLTAFTKPGMKDIQLSEVEEEVLRMIEDKKP